MKSLILILLSVVLWGACATDVDPSSDEQGIDADASGQSAESQICHGGDDPRGCDLPPPSVQTPAKTDPRYINSEGGTCTDTSGQPCFCNSIGCDDGGIGGGPGGGGTGGGGGDGSPTTPYPTCRYTVQCWPESCVTPDYACQLCQTLKQCTDGTTQTFNEYNCYPTSDCD